MTKTMRKLRSALLLLPLALTLGLTGCNKPTEQVAPPPSDGGRGGMQPTSTGTATGAPGQGTAPGGAVQGTATLDK